MRTAYNGVVEGSFTSLPFGDGQASSGTDGDQNHYATLDHDAESNTDHAQYRQYSNAQGRWLRPDPYSGSYDFSNPQSFNRYAYVLNNPLAAVDPSGWECVWDDGSFDSADDPDTGTADSCEAAGGSYVPPELFEDALLPSGAEWTSAFGDWSSAPNSDLASWSAASADTSDSGTQYGSSTTFWLVPEGGPDDPNNGVLKPLGRAGGWPRS